MINPHHKSQFLKGFSVLTRLRERFLNQLTSPHNIQGFEFSSDTASPLRWELNEISNLVPREAGLRFDISSVSAVTRDQIENNRYSVQAINQITTLSPPPPDVPFINFGGGMGIIDCIQNQRMKTPEAHISVEGNPYACRISERNRDLNNCSYKILNAALCYKPSVDFFMPSPRNELITNGGIDDRFILRGVGGQKLTVPGVSLRDILHSYDLGNRIAICVDIAGAETAFVQRELELITSVADWLMIRWHYPNERTHPECIRGALCKRALKQRMIFDKENSTSRLSLFYRK
ncbi:hypothetical protein [Falsiruegeria litorea]|uniref:FkbM family methyltransferase n=1 Tax=Falsiruegeria litorea TaxID=1280831 RepID=A0ABS5WLL2_9RHOB|nr:hypothetical protein [Falsiruegeria litorea]MBT3140015.1 hypothetical protein [Falsiruegeria litorea]MBT8167162.1 hypothetical protein [Falsiruegeria litorea]